MRESAFSRRSFLTAGALAAAGVALPRRLFAAEPGRLTVRHKRPTKTTAPGDYVLADEAGRRAILHVPASYVPTKPAPFLIALHGASGSGERMLTSQRIATDAHGVVVLSPSSRGGTWDAIRGRFADDCELIDRLIGEVFDRCAIDPVHMAIGGFSDGATYALSLGLINGDFFTHIVAHSPGFIVSGQPHGRPKIFVSHGREDPILPIDQCGRRIVAQLTRAGYAPRFDEFDGGHTASPEMRERAMAWFLSL